MVASRPLPPKMIAAFGPVLEWLESGAPNTEVEGFGKVGFNHSSFIERDAEDARGNACGTVCCIAGALKVFSGVRPSGRVAFGIDETRSIGRNVGMNDTQIANLLYARNFKRGGKPVAMRDVTPHDAAFAIRNMLATGRVTWPGCERRKPPPPRVAPPQEQGPRCGCHIDLEPGQEPDGCVLDEGRPGDCEFATLLTGRVRAEKSSCPFWKPVERSSK